MSAPTEPPLYKGEPLDSERGPGLGCFWIQIALLTFFLIFTPLTVTWGWDSRISGALLIFTLILLLFSGQTIIFLLRLVAADRRTRRTPLDPTARPTVGQMEDTVSEVPAQPAESAAPGAMVQAAAPDEEPAVAAAPDEEPAVAAAPDEEPQVEPPAAAAPDVELAAAVPDEEPQVEPPAAAAPDDHPPSMRPRDDG